MTNRKKVMPFLESQKKYVLDMVSSGSTIKEVSELLNVSKNYISEFCRINGVHYNLERFTEYELNILRNNLDMENQEIQKRYMPYRTIKCIGSKIKLMGLSKVVGRIWTEEDLEILRSNFPNVSYSTLQHMLPDYTKSEIQYMSKKLKLFKSSERVRARYIENGMFAEGYLKKTKYESALSELTGKNNGDAHLVYSEFKLLYGEKAYNKKKIYDFLVKNGCINPKKYYLYLEIYHPRDIALSYEQSFELYNQFLLSGCYLDISFDKETTKKLFIYWAGIVNFDLSRDALLSKKEFRKDFIQSGLGSSIRKNYKYTYNFLSDLLNDSDLKPYHTAIQVPDYYWRNKDNFFEMLDESIAKMIDDKTIDNPEDILYLDKGVLLDYIYHNAIHKGTKTLLRKYLNSRNIAYDEKKVKYYDGFYFDSQEEMRVYKFIKNLGYDIVKCSRFDKYYNEKYDENYIPDFKISIKNEVYICEYFGLYSNRYFTKTVLEYKNRADRKIEYFSENFNFIYFLPNDFEKGLKGIGQKLEERR